jgi:SagB-type dehydrogenase family enzyme
MRDDNPLRFFHRFIRKTSLSRWDVNLPQFDPKITYKHYLRFEQIPLSNESGQGSSIQRLINRRRSRRSFGNKQPGLGVIAYVLNNACGLTEEAEDGVDFLRTYPSAGARYPLETYLFALTKGELHPGLYHYNVRRRTLEVLDLRTDTRKLQEAFDQEFMLHAHLLLILTACPHRTLSKYGSRGARHIFIEAGHVGQNICLLCEDVGLNCCPIGGFLDNQLSRMLYLDPNEELPVYALAIG